MTLQDQMSKLSTGIRRHAPEILTTVSVAGLVTTAYLGARAGYKAGIHVVSEFSARLDNAADDEEVLPLAAKEIVKDTWKFYIPVFVVGVGTVIAVIGSNRISAKQQVALISAAALSERALSEYQQKIVETTSRPKEQKVRDEILQDQVEERADQLNRLGMPKDGDVLVIESHTKQVLISNAEKIHRAENDANRQAIHDGYVSLNTFLDFLGLPTSDAGDVVGWTAEKPIDVRIGGATLDEKPVLTINYVTPPSVTYMRPF